MYDKNQIDAVIISTADFQHALHTVEAAKAKKDVYVEKPFAETMEDARLGKKAANDAGIVLQVGSHVEVVKTIMLQINTSNQELLEM